jgi:DNA-binding beta-propeller fold protein YncE
MATAEPFWAAPPPPDGQVSSITGIAWDPTRDALIVTDPEINTVYRVALADGSEEILYAHGQLPNAPGFDGAVVTPDGEVYVAALGQNGIARVNTAAGTLDYIAGLFRGSSDIEYQRAQGRFIVTNFDQASLVLPLLAPSLPFTIDTVTLNEEALPEATAAP